MNVKYHKLHRVMLLAVAALLSTAAPAQRPFLEDGKKWEMYSTVFMRPLVQAGDTYRVERDTIVGGEACKVCTLGDAKAVLSEADGKVYYVPEGTTKRLLVYDFNMQPGEVREVYPVVGLLHTKDFWAAYGVTDAEDLVCQAVCTAVSDYVAPGGETFRRLSIEWTPVGRNGVMANFYGPEPMPVFQTAWVEGVGNVTDPFEGLMVGCGLSSTERYLRECAVCDASVLYGDYRYNDAKTFDRAPIAAAYRDFAFRFFGKCDAQSATGNIVVSPFSAQLALGMLQNGADGNTLDEMKAALGVKDCTQEQINIYNMETMQHLAEVAVPTDEEKADYEAFGGFDDSSVPSVAFADGMWLSQDYPFDGARRVMNTIYYDASTASVDFGQQATFDAINAWASEHTAGRITDLGMKPNPSMAMVLANALYYKGAWAAPFREEATEDLPFYNADGTVVSVPMMKQSGYMPLFESDAFYAVKRYFGYDDQYSMTLFLPRDAAQPAPLTQETWQRAQEQMQSCEVALQLPRFKVESDLSLNDVLYALGIRDALSANADFSGFSSQPLGLSLIKQITKLGVDEQGAEGATVTVVAMDVSDITHVPSYVAVNFDHPFYFTLEDNHCHTILYMGHIRHHDGDILQSLSSVTTQQPARAYDLAGRRVSSLGQHGVYVDGGKKVLIAR